MKAVAALAILSILAVGVFYMSSSPSSAVEGQFRDFLEVHSASYGTSEEYAYRLSVFESNLKLIEKLNKLNPEATFAVNKFADRTPEEMSRLRGYRGGKQTNKVHVSPVNAQSVDWTDMWTSVKDQKACGSCWAFSATAGFESRYALNSGAKKVSKLFAEQELVDCDPQSDGCNGGLMTYAFEYLEENGFCLESQYPYTARDGTCKASSLCGSGPMDKAYVELPSGNEDKLLSELANGPVSVAVDAETWSFYSGGILSSCYDDLDHGVTLVKYDASENSVTIRNSWGSSWGEKGYIRLKVGQDTCGYADDASYPTY